MSGLQNLKSNTSHGSVDLSHKVRGGKTRIFLILNTEYSKRCLDYARHKGGRKAMLSNYYPYLDRSGEVSRSH